MIAVADLANATLSSGGPIGDRHKLDDVADSPPPSYDIPPAAVPMHVGWRPRRKGLLAYIDVYVDDFLGLCQGPPAR